MHSKVASKTYSTVGILALWGLLAGCYQNRCVLFGEDCSLSLGLDDNAKIFSDRDNNLKVHLIRHLPSLSISATLSQSLTGASPWTISPWELAPPPADTPLPYAIEAPLSLTKADLQTHKFQIGNVTLSVQEQAGSLAPAAAQDLSLVDSRFVFHLDSTSGKSVLPQPPDLMSDNGLQTIGFSTVNNKNPLFVIRSYANGVPRFYINIYKVAGPGFTLTKDMAPETSVSPEPKLSFPSYVSMNYLWYLYYTDHFSLYTKSFSDLTAGETSRSSTQVSAKVASLLAVTPDGKTAIIADADGKLFYFPTTGTKLQLNPVSAVLGSEVKALTIGTIDWLGTTPGSPVLLVATKDCSVRSFDLATFAQVEQLPLVPFELQATPDKCQLDALAVGNLDGRAADELVTASGNTLYIWARSAGSGSFQLASVLNGLPAGASVRSIAIGDVNGDRAQDLVVATADNLYVFLHDLPPLP